MDYTNADKLEIVRLALENPNFETIGSHDGFMNSPLLSALFTCEAGYLVLKPEIKNELKQNEM